jgi:transposase
MSLRPQICPSVPEETVRIARASFPKGSRYMRLRDELGAVFDDSRFAGLFPTRGRPAEAPWRLALVTLFQFAEGLPDRQAAEAVRGRIDWKYALALPLADPGFDSTVLSEFRSRLIEGGAEQVLLDTVLALARERNLLSAGGRQRTDSTHVLAAVRALNRLECVVETMRHALDSLAVAAPDWLRAHAQADWAERYGHRAMDDRLAKNAARRNERARTVGQDGHALLAAALAPAAPGWLRQVPAVEILRRVWVQQFYLSAEGVQWRAAEHGIPPSSLFLSSPHDTDAHLGRKRTTKWIGYKAHLTETCDDGRPHLITHVQTMAAPVADGEATTPAHTALRDKGLLPAMHLVDTGYLDAELLVTTRRDFGVDLAGPARADERWQAREGKGFAAADFNVDWERKEATCPQGAVSASWTPAFDNRGVAVIKIKFSGSDCGPCRHLADCVRGKRARRSVTLRTHELHTALAEARRRGTTAEFAALSAVRAGVEGTISQAVRGFGLRRSRYVGRAKTHLQHVATAAAMNLVRITEWLGGSDLATTRRSRFRTLMAEVA